jgi:hypothetical protein
MKKMEQACKTLTVSLMLSMVIMCVIGMAASLLSGFEPATVSFFEKEMTPIVRLLLVCGCLGGILWLIFATKFFRQIPECLQGSVKDC